jgi:Zn-dependent protease
MFTFTLWEIIQIIITILAVGVIFSGLIKRPQTYEDMLAGKTHVLQDLKFAIAVAAPAVIFHELAHKFLALYYGFSATYSASWWGLGIGLMLRFLAPGWIFFIPGYVSISGLGTHLQYGLTALAGPLTNLILFGIFWLLLQKNITPKYSAIWHIAKQINLWLFVFNMLPIPGLDGFSFYSSFF